MDIEVDCHAPGCESGRIRHQDSRIDPKYIKFHLENHAYTKVGHQDAYRATSIGADCDCPRTLDKPRYGTCQACKGTGVKTVHLVIPKPGRKVRIIDDEIAEAIFGDNVPTDPGVVFDVQTPEEHKMELRSGIGVRVTWGKLTSGYKIPKGSEVELWTFDLLELELK